MDNKNTEEFMCFYISSSTRQELLHSKVHDTKVSVSHDPACWFYNSKS